MSSEPASPLVIESNGVEGIFDGLVQAAIEQMDPIDREVLALRHFEELTNSEVAETLGIEQKAASIRYIRALRRLKEILAQVPDIANGGQHG